MDYASSGLASEGLGNIEALLTADETARLLGVEPITLAIWRSRNGRQMALPFVKIGRMVRYRRQDVDKFITDCLRCAA